MSTWTRKRNTGNIYNIEAGTYTVYLKVVGNCPNARFTIALEDTDMKTIVSGVVGVSNSSLIKVATFNYDGTTEIVYTSIVLESLRTNSSYGCTFYPMLMKDTYTADVTYEQYGASPSPDYPSEIETVGSNINFINMEDSEEKTSNGMTYSIKNNILKIKGTATANNTLIFNSKTQVNLKANTYTLNANKSGSLAGVFEYYIYGTLTPSGGRKVLIDGGNLASSTNTGIKTQTLTENNYYNCSFAIYFAKNCTTDMTLMPKLEEGSIATP